jgi:hypothetical protein
MMVISACVTFALTIASFVEFGIETGRLPYMRRGIVTLTALGLLWAFAVGDDEELAVGLAGIWLIMLAAVRTTMLIYAVCGLARERWATWRDVN